MEKGERALKQQMMEKIAEALAVTPTHLIANFPSSILVPGDVHAVDDLDPAIANALSKRSLLVYKVVGRSVINAGLAPGATITVDTTEAARHPEKLAALDVVLVRVHLPGRGADLVLRQFVPPQLLVTNHDGTNQAMTLDDGTLRPEIVGVLVRD